MTTKKTTKKTTGTSAEPGPAKLGADMNANNAYEQWKVDVRKLDGVYEFEQRKKIKTVYITDAMADRMNVQSRNSGIRYYKV